MREAAPSSVPDSLAGELRALVQVYRGEWGTGRDGTTGIGLAGRYFFNPFHLVDAQLNEGESASVAAFFASVPSRLKAPPAVRKAWIS